MAEAQLIMSDFVEKKVLFTTEAVPNAYSAGGHSEVILEVSRVPRVAPTYNAPGQKEDVVETVDAVLDIVTGFCTIGAAIPVPPANLAFAAVAAFSGLIQFGISLFAPEKENPINKKMKILQEKMEELNEKTMAHFAAMKTFITENHLNIEIINEISTMKRLMIDCILHRTEESTENFRSAYERHTPLELAYVLMCLLNQPSTNPLVMAMSAEEAKTVSTFNKWENIIRAIMGDLMLLESFGAGLLRNKESIHDWNRLNELKEDAFEHLQELKAINKKDNAYWAEMKEYVEDFVPGKNEWNNEKKANNIEAKLATYLTSDSFYVLVFDECKWHDDFTYLCTDEKNNLLYKRVKGKCCIIVYRSREAHKKNEKEFKTMLDNIEGCRLGKLTYGYAAIEHVIQEQILDRNLMPRYGFICLVWKDKHVHFRFIEQSREPGRLTEIVMDRPGKDWNLTYLFFTAFD